MKKVIIDYTQRTPLVVKDRAINVSKKLYTVVEFNNPPVSQDDLDAQIVVVTDKITAAANRDREKLAELRAEKLVLAVMLRQLAEYVNTTVTDGDEAKLLSSGFEISKTPEKNQLPSSISKIEAAYTN